MALAWKAGWDKTLGSSNLPSSAVAAAVPDRSVAEPVSLGLRSRHHGATMEAVAIDLTPVSLADLLEIARGAPVELTDGARERIASGRRVVDGVLASGRAVYGLTTGGGHNRDVRVPDDELVGQQYRIVMTHSGGFGPLLPTEVTRAAMAVRLVGLTRGGAGARPAAAQALLGPLHPGAPPH